MVKQNLNSMLMKYKKYNHQPIKPDVRRLMEKYMIRGGVLEDPLFEDNPEVPETIEELFEDNPEVTETLEELFDEPIDSSSKDEPKAKKSKAPLEEEPEEKDPFFIAKKKEIKDMRGEINKMVNPNFVYNINTKRARDKKTIGNEELEKNKDIYLSKDEYMKKLKDLDETLMEAGKKRIAKQNQQSLERKAEKKEKEEQLALEKKEKEEQLALERKAEKELEEAKKEKEEQLALEKKEKEEHMTTVKETFFPEVSKTFEKILEVRKQVDEEKTIKMKLDKVREERIKAEKELEKIEGFISQGKIYNPYTNRWVDRDGSSGKQLRLDKGEETTKQYIAQVRDEANQAISSALNAQAEAEKELEKVKKELEKERERTSELSEEVLSGLIKINETKEKAEEDIKNLEIENKFIRKDAELQRNEAEKRLKKVLEEAEIVYKETLKRETDENRKAFEEMSDRAVQLQEQINELNQLIEKNKKETEDEIDLANEALKETGELIKTQDELNEEYEKEIKELKEQLEKANTSKKISKTEDDIKKVTSDYERQIKEYQQRNEDLRKALIANVNDITKLNSELDKARTKAKREEEKVKREEEKARDRTIEKARREEEKAKREEARSSKSKEPSKPPSPPSKTEEGSKIPAINIIAMAKAVSGVEDDKIINPDTGRKVSINSPIGKKLFQKKLEQQPKKRGRPSKLTKKIDIPKKVQAVKVRAPRIVTKKSESNAKKSEPKTKKSKVPLEEEIKK